MAGEIVNMNINLNNINATGMSGISAGVMSNVGAMQSMEAFSTAMTTPGNMEAPSDVMAKLTGIGDNKTSLAENASKLNVCNSYLEACNGSHAEGASLSGMKGAFNTEGDAAQIMDKCLDKCFGENISAQEKNNVVSFYAKTSAQEAPKTMAKATHIASANSAQTAAKPQIASSRPYVGQQPNVAKQTAASAASNVVPKANVMNHSQVASAQAPKVATRNAATQSAPTVKVAVPAQTPSLPETAFADMLANQPSINDLMANLDLSNHTFDAGMFKMPDFGGDSSVLAQYKQNSENGSQMANLMNDYAAQMENFDMSAFTGMGNGDIAGLSGLMNADGTINPDIANGLKPANNPMDLIGSTAMSTNMANLENMVNIDLLNDMISGEGLRKS